MAHIREQVTNLHLSVAAGFISVILATAAYIIPMPLVSYPLIAAFIGSVIYLSTLLPKFKLNISRFPVRLLTVGILVATFSIPAIQTASTQQIPNLFYLIAEIVCFLLVLRILNHVGRPAIPLLLILSFSLILRSTFWFSTAVFGQDSIYHMGIIGWLIQNGGFLPAELSYYSKYPVSHYLGVAGSIVMGFNTQTFGELKLATFLTLSIAQTTGILFVYSIINRLLRNSTAALLGALFFGISSGPLIMGAKPIAQSVATLFIAGAIWALTTSLNARIFTVYFFLSATSVATHNLAPLAIGGSAILFLGLDQLLPNRFKICPRSSRLDSVSIRGISVGLTVAILGIQYWSETNYLSYQVLRIITIFSFSATGSEAVSSTNFAEPPQVAVFGHVLPGLLMWAAQLLILITVVGVGVWMFLEQLSLQPDWELEIPTYWGLAATISFGIFAIAYAIGGSGPVTRTLPTVTLIISPLVAFAFVHLYKRSLAGPAVVVILVCAVLTSSILLPGLAYPDRETGDFRPTATSNEVAATEHAHRYIPEDIVADSYIANFDKWRQVSKGQYPQRKITGIVTHTDPSSVNRYHREINSEEGLLFRDRNDEVFGIHPPPTWSRIYSFGRNESGIYIP